MKKIFVQVCALIVTSTIGLYAQYCSPTQDCSFGDYINNFSTTGGIANITNNGSGCSAGGYQYFTQTVSQQQGSSINISVQSGPSWAQGFRIWVDWNQDGDFVDAGEDVWNSATSGTGVFTGSITVPISATPGTTRMRVRCKYNSVPTDPCATITYGETEDYDFNVVALTPCTAPPTPGTVSFSSNPVCPSTSVTMQMVGYSTGSGQTYQWQTSPTGQPGTWVDIPGATSPSYTTTVSASAYFRAYLTCSGQSDTTPGALLTVTPHYNCYCASAATSSADEYIDTVRIGNFVNQSYGVCGGYQNFTTSFTPPVLFKTSSYPSAISTRDCEGSFFYSRYVEVYIDFDQDGVYQDPAELVLSGSLPGALQNSVSGLITIPSSAATGITGMRVVCREGGTSSSTQPCGTYFWGETEDYLVDIRPFPNNDVGLLSIISPTQAPTNSCNVKDTAIVVISTSGLNTLTSADIQVEVNGVVVLTYNWTGSLSSGQTDTINLGFVNFNDGDFVKIWVENPNGSTDEFDGNDTLSLFVYNALSGIYTIGGASPDFTTLNNAVSALMMRGICNDVIFNIRSGVYNEQVSIGQYPVVGSGNYRVTFQSETLNANDVTIDFAPGSSANNYLFDLNGADNVTLNRLTLKNTSNFSTAVRLGNGANNIIIENNQIIGDTLAAAVDPNKHTINSTSANDNNLIIRNNTIRGGSRSIWLWGDASTHESGVKITNNIITDYYQAGVVLIYQVRPEVSNNQIFSDTSNGIGNIFHLDIEDALNGAIVIGNYVNGRQSGFGINIVNVDANASNPTWITNNMVHMGSTTNGTYSEAIALQDVTNANVVFNSAHVRSANTQTAAIRIFMGSSNGINIKNNNLVNSGAGLAVNSDSKFYIAESDYNNFYVSGSNVVSSDGNTYANLAAWQAASGFDTNSISVDPNFVDEDLHTCRTELDGAATPISGIGNDFDNDVRNASTPDIGADEFISSANFTLGPDIIKCPADTVTLSADVINGATYNWSPFFQTTPSITASAANTYVVQIVTSCGLATDTVVVSNYPPANASFTSTVNFFSVVFNNTSTNGVSYHWDFGDGNFSTDMNPTHIYNSEGTYTVVLTVTDQCGNTSTSSQEVTIDVQYNSLEEEAIQQLNVYPNPTEAAVFVQFVFDGTKDIHIRMVDLAGRMIYSWNMGTHTGVFSSQFDLSALPAGTYMMVIQAGEYSKLQRIVVK